MAGLVIDADGHVMEQHQDLFAHIKGNFGEMDWHSTWPIFDADGWQRGLSRKGKREDPNAEAWIRFQNENGIDCAVLYPTSALALGMIQLPAWASALAQGYMTGCIIASPARRRGSKASPCWRRKIPKPPLRNFVAQLKNLALSAVCYRRSRTTEPRSTARLSFTKSMMRHRGSTCRSPFTAA